MTYANRGAAGDALAAELSGYAGRTDVVVLGLVRGGVPVAARVAGALGAPLDVLVVRKLGVPWAPEVAFGALGPAGVIVDNPPVRARVSAGDAAEVTSHEKAELFRRDRLYRRDHAAVDLTGKVAIIVDDGLATGTTARAAVTAARRLGAASVVLAVPVGAPDALALLRREADAVICPLAPPDFASVSRHYATFGQTSDDEVVQLIAMSTKRE